MSIIVILENAGRGCAIFGLGAFARVAGRLGVGCFEYRTAFPNLLGLLARWSFPLRFQPSKQSRCGISNPFHLSFFAPAFHKQDQTTGVAHEVGSIDRERGNYS